MKFTTITDRTELFRSHCRLHGRCGIYLRWDAHQVPALEHCSDEDKEAGRNILLTSLDEPLRSDRELVFHLMYYRWAYILLDTDLESKLYDVYQAIHGDDTGGTIYALTCNSRGEILNENS